MQTIKNRVIGESGYYYILNSNINDKKCFIKGLSGTVILTSIFLFLTQLVHFFNISFLVDLMRLPLQTQRFSGNLFQPNQTAFVLVLGVVSTIFFLENKKYLKFLRLLI